MPHSRTEGGASWRTAWPVLVAFAFAALAASARAADLASASAVKAAYLHKFGSFVEWPAGTFRAGEPFVIGVYGDDAVASELEQLARRQGVEGRPLTVLRLREAGDAQALHLLFAGGPRPRKARDVLEAARGPVLTVADGVTSAQPGPVLSFGESRGRVYFIASLPAAAARNLKLSSRLLAVAQQVEGR